MKTKPGSDGSNLWRPDAIGMPASSDLSEFPNIILNTHLTGYCRQNKIIF